MIRVDRLREILELAPADAQVHADDEGIFIWLRERAYLRIDTHEEPAVIRGIPPHADGCDFKAATLSSADEVRAFFEAVARWQPPAEATGGGERGGVPSA